MRELAISIRNYNEDNYKKIIDSIKEVKFKNKVFTIHLHDNFKIKDDHNLPFDGTVNWKKIIKQVIYMNYTGYIVIEIGYNNYYKNLNLEEYYKLAYERGIQVIKLIELYKS